MCWWCLTWGTATPRVPCARGTCATHVCDRWQPWWHSETRPQHGCQTDDNPMVPPRPPCATIITLCPHHHPVPPIQDTCGSPRVRSSPGDTLRASRSTSQVTTPKCHVTHPCHHHHLKVPPSPCVTTTMCHPPELACATHVGNSPSDTETLSQQCQPGANPKVPPCPPRATIITLCHLPGAHEGHPELEAAPLTPRDHTPQHCQPGDSP